MGISQFWNTVQMVFAAMGGWLGWFLGGNDGLLYALIAFVVIDYITGAANILDVYVIGNGSVLRTAVIFFYISNEGVSLLENAAHLGLPVPEKMKAVLEQLHNRDGKDGE